MPLRVCVCAYSREKVRVDAHIVHTVFIHPIHILKNEDGEAALGRKCVVIRVVRSIHT
jgi:hypothetical protein